MYLKSANATFCVLLSFVCFNRMCSLPPSSCVGSSSHVDEGFVVGET